MKLILTEQNNKCIITNHKECIKEADLREITIMKTYVMMFGFANIVAGGPIYNRNKIRYLRERGWNVVVFPTNDGKVYIKGLECYSSTSYPFITLFPLIFSKRELNRLIENMAEQIDPNSTEIIIETGTDYTAYWGELLAKRLNAKHFVLFLDEKNERVNKYTIPFFEFKHKRRELACIVPSAMQHLFEDYKIIPENERYALRACCSNSVEDYPSKFADGIKRGDYNIGTIGRLDKSFVMPIIDGVGEFAESFPDKQIVFCLIGGASDAVIETIVTKLKKHPNIKFYISGYMWPIPLTLINKCDVFISGSGSARITANINIPTIAMDIYKNVPLGFISDLSQEYMTNDKDEFKSIKVYLQLALIDHKYPVILNRMNIQDMWQCICKEFDIHMQFIKQSCCEKDYYPIDKRWNGDKRLLFKKLIMYLLGYEKYNKFRFKYRKLLHKM